jgi:hypothetical protein
VSKLRTCESTSPHIPTSLWLDAYLISLRKKHYLFTFIIRRHSEREMLMELNEDRVQGQTVM